MSDSSTGGAGQPPPTSPSPAALRKWRGRLADEREEAKVYRSLASRRTGEEREILLELAEAEERHAAHWAKLLGDDVGPERRGDVRMRMLAWLARHFGSVFVLALAQRAETRSPYDTDMDATRAMAADERVHEEVVRGARRAGAGHRVSGTFRAAVFGANDGLVSNLALVLGVSGGGVVAQAVLLTGLAGLLAGALSMGAGEYVSVRSQRELLEASAPGPTAHTAVPQLDVDANELALVYRARGMPPEEAERHAADLLRHYPRLEHPGEPARRVTTSSVPVSPGCSSRAGWCCRSSAAYRSASSGGIPPSPVDQGQLVGIDVQLRHRGVRGRPRGRPRTPRCRGWTSMPTSRPWSTGLAGCRPTRRSGTRPSSCSTTRWLDLRRHRYRPRP